MADPAGFWDVAGRILAYEWPDPNPNRYAAACDIHDATKRAYMLGGRDEAGTWTGSATAVALDPAEFTDDGNGNTVRGIARTASARAWRGAMGGIDGDDFYVLADGSVAPGNPPASTDPTIQTPAPVIDRYSITADTWTLDVSTSVPGPARRQWACAVVAGKVIVFGGRFYDTPQPANPETGANGVTYAEVHVWDIATQTWSRVTDMPAARYWPHAPGAVAVDHVNGHVYLFGGSVHTGNAITTNSGAPDFAYALWRYDVAADTWTVLTPWRQSDFPDDGVLQQGSIGYNADEHEVWLAGQIYRYHEDPGDPTRFAEVYPWHMYDIAGDAWRQEEFSLDAHLDATVAGHRNIASTVSPARAWVGHWSDLVGQAIEVSGSTEYMVWPTFLLSSQNLFSDMHGFWGEPSSRYAPAQQIIAATPAHAVISPSGEAAYPIVSAWQASERANGGQVGHTGRVSGAFVRAHRDVFVDGADWFVYRRETGEVLFWGRLKAPAHHPGVVDLAGDGAARIAEREFERLLLRVDGVGDVATEQDEVYNPTPPEAPQAGDATGAHAAGLAGGEYEWGITFVDADGVESGIGPTVALELDPLDGGGPSFHVTIKRIARGPDGTTARKLYRKDPTDPDYRLVTTINDNTTERYVDSTPDGTLGAVAPPTSGAVEVQMKARKSSLQYRLERDAFVRDSQRADFVFYAREAELSGLKAVVRPNRVLPNYELRVLSGIGPAESFTLEQTYALDSGAPFEIEVPFTSAEADMWRLRLKRIATGSDAEPVHIVIDHVRTYGLATMDDDEFTPSDVAREVFSRLPVTIERVRQSGYDAMPQDWQRSPAGEVLDFNALLLRWRWLLYRRALDVAADWGPYDTRIWIANDDRMVHDLLPLPRYSRVTVAYDTPNGEREYVDAVASPNPLGVRVTYPTTVVLDTRGSRSVAQQIAELLVEYLVQVRYAGTFTFDRIQGVDGALYGCHFVRAGDAIYFPALDWLGYAEELQRETATCIASFPDGIPLLDRLQARLSLRLTI